MTHIKLITKPTTEQSSVLPLSSTQRIIAWNRERNNLKFDIDLETQMLTEEAQEFYQAETLVDRIDAWCDFIFVGTGTIIKYLAVKSKCFADQKEMVEQVDFLSSWMEHQRMQMVELLTEEVSDIWPKMHHSEEDLLDELLRKCLDIVIDANEKKGTTKDENGKVIKHPDFQKPEKILDALLKKTIGAKYVSQF